MVLFFLNFEVKLWFKIFTDDEEEASKCSLKDPQKN